MEIEIKHGISTNKFIVIVQPKRRYQEARLSDEKRTIVILEDPKTGNKVKTELYDYWTVQEGDFEEMNGLAYLAYGWPANELKPLLLKQYPELRNNFIVEYWLLKRID